MKCVRYCLLILCAFVSRVSAEVITMDLTTATDMDSASVMYSSLEGDGFYNLTDVWSATYDDSDAYSYIYTNDARFQLSHLPSRMSYGGQSWEGFTLSRVSQDTANVFGCVANGGLAGEGTPYVIGYFSEWVTASQGYSSNIILFDREYYPEYVYICQNSNTMEAITNGGVFNARAFTEKDTLTLIISALDSTLQEVSTLNYYLAVDGKKNSEWVQVPLTALGGAKGLSFKMTTTDNGSWGSNTPLYFALDGLTVNTEPLTALPHIQVGSLQPQKIHYNGQVYIFRNGVYYTLMGQVAFEI